MEDGELRELLLRACHDLRTPVRAVRTNAELLRIPEKREGPDATRIVDFLVDGAKRLDTLVEGLAAYTLALHTDSAMFGPVRLGTALKAAMARLATDLRDSGAEVTSDDLPRVQGDPDRLTQLLENLLRNAIQNRGELPLRIHLSASQDTGVWTIAVNDNGAGIEPAEAERVIRPFSRLRKTAKGAGMGLVACREIVVRHGGRIWIESAEGAGTTVFFTLPE